MSVDARCHGNWTLIVVRVFAYRFTDLSVVGR